MKVAAFQFDVSDGDVEHNLAQVHEGLTRAADEGAVLVVLPEMWPTSFTAGAGEEELRASEDAVERVKEWSQSLELVVCGSGYGRVDAELPANRFHVLDRGEVAGIYDKVHLFSPAAEDVNFTAGDAWPSVIETSVGKLAPSICYDLRFPEPYRAAYFAGAEIGVCSAQWPVVRAGHWGTLLRGRAVEGQWPMIGANRTGRAVIGRRRLELEFSGNSMIVSPHGEVLAEGEGQAGLVMAELDLSVAQDLRRRLPIAKDGRVSKLDPPTRG